MYRTNVYSLGALFMGTMLLLTVACTPGGSVTPTVEMLPAQLEGTEWVLVRYGPAAAPVEPLVDNPPTLSFDNGSLGGTTGCNSYGGDFRVEGDQLIVGDIFQTLIACPEPIMQQEEAYLGALRTVETFTLVDERLTLYHEGGELHFVRH
jgi:heat shock protein HslJ